MDELIRHLKDGTPTPKDDSAGGFLVPQFMSVPSPGKRAAFWRFVGDVLFVLGRGRLGMIAYDKGCHQVNMVEYLKSRVR